MQMSTIELTCRWCDGGPLATRAHGAKARWVVQDPQSPEQTQLVECSSCGLLYFSTGFSEQELSNMYNGYRGDAYFERRHRFEPWYTRSVNDSIGHSVEVLTHRKENLERFLQEAIVAGAVRAPSRVLDVGGDEGQFIPDLPTVVARGVLEVSSVQLVEDVETIQSWDDARGFSPDMIMMCHVLEHTSEARDMVVRAASTLQPGGLLYLEVPLDRPRRIPSYLRSTVQSQYTGLLTRHPKLFLVADLISLVSRRILGFALPGSVVKQSEHINFFTADCLSRVAESLGFAEVSRTEYKPTSGVPVLDVTAAGLLMKRV